MRGEAGNDTIAGGLGNDALRGDAGKDTFVFNTALSATSNVDAITDFYIVDDAIRLENAIFTKIAGTGTFTSVQFVKNTTGLAIDANVRVMYEATPAHSITIAMAVPQADLFAFQHFKQI